MTLNAIYRIADKDIKVMVLIQFISKWQVAIFYQLEIVCGVAKTFEHWIKDLIH